MPAPGKNQDLLLGRRERKTANRGGMGVKKTFQRSWGQDEQIIGDYLIQGGGVPSTCESNPAFPTLSS